MASLANSTQRRINTNPSQTLKKLRRREYFQTHSTRAPLPCYQREVRAPQEKYKPISLINIDTKIINKILANQIQEYTERIIYQG